MLIGQGKRIFKMKFIRSTNRKFLMGVIVASVLAISSFFLFQSGIGKSQNLSQLNNGLNTCFNRVTQTFTAIMIQQLESAYLTREFTDLTSSCFNDLQKEFQSIAASGVSLGMSQNLKTAKGVLNQLVSDGHWFHEKALKIQEMSKNENFNLTNSNIMNKFSSLESVKDKMQDKIYQIQSDNQKVVTASKALGLFFILLVMGVGVAWIYNAARSAESLVEVETIADKMLQDNNFPNDKVDRLLEMAFSAANLPKSLEIFQNYKIEMFHSNLNPVLTPALNPATNEENNGERSIEDSAYPTKNYTNLNNAFNAALKGVQSKAFTYGVIVDFHLDDDLMIYGEQEDIQQVIYSLLGHAIDSSMNHNQGRKVIVRSKALGGTIYLKVNISNFCFNASELEYMTDVNSQESGVNLNLVMIKELAAVNEVQFSVTNKVDSSGELKGSEVELIFQRAKVSPTSEKDIFDFRNADHIERKRFFHLSPVAEQKSNNIIEISNSSEVSESEIVKSETVTMPEKKINSIVKGSKKELLAKFKSRKDANI